MHSSDRVAKWKRPAQALDRCEKLGADCVAAQEELAERGALQEQLAETIARTRAQAPRQAQDFATICDEADARLAAVCGERDASPPRARA